MFIYRRVDSEALLCEVILRHTLSPSWHPHEVRQSESKRMDRNPGWIGGGAFTPEKNLFTRGRREKKI